MAELFEVFDRHNRLVGMEARDVVHARGLYHRSVHVFVLNPKGDLLMQRRSDQKDTCPGVWDLSAAEHAQPLEYPYQTALRGLREELSITTSTVTLLEGFHLNEFHYPELNRIDREFVQTFLALHDGEIGLCSDEVAEASYWPLERVVSVAHKEPRQLTPWLLRDLPTLLQWVS